MITFERVNKENLYIAKEMMDSNSCFYDSKYDGSYIKENELSSLNSNENSLLIKVEDTYIGLTSYKEHPEEKNISISIFMIHADYQGFGYGTAAYYHLKDLLVKHGYKSVSLDVSSENSRAKQFWERNGFIMASNKKAQNGIEMTRYEKHL